MYSTVPTVRHRVLGSKYTALRDCCLFAGALLRAIPSGSMGIDTQVPGPKLHFVPAWHSTLYQWSRPVAEIGTKAMQTEEMLVLRVFKSAIRH